MFADNLTARANDKYGIVKLPGFPLRTREKHPALELIHEPAEPVHPWVRLRLNPLGPRDVWELKPAHSKLRRHDPLRADFGCASDGLHRDAPISLDVAGRKMKMEQRDLSWIHFHSYITL
jgi:hypothetical protein